LLPASIARTSQTSEAPSLWHGRWLWLTVIVAIGFLLLCRLGIWQLQRLQQRREANALLMTRLNRAPLTLTGQDVDPEEMDLSRVITTGQYDYDQEIILRNQSLGGAPGAHVVTPLRLAGSDRAVLVDRGWVPLDEKGAPARSAAMRPAGEVTVHGVARQSQTRPSYIAPADLVPASGGRLDAWFRVNIPQIQQQIPYPLLPIFIQEGEPTEADPAVSGNRLPVPYVQIDLSEGSHLGYAIQWFAFAAILLAGYVLFFRSQTMRTWEPEPGGEQDMG
jgi:surfeit locus 1 family protein